jgi:hypothetical protein
MSGRSTMRTSGGLGLEDLSWDIDYLSALILFYAGSGNDSANLEAIARSELYGWWAG